MSPSPPPFGASGASGPSGTDHLAVLAAPLRALGDDVGRIDAWGSRLAGVLLAGGRLLAAGNGGSAALAQHLTGELVGRFRDERPALSALALHAETSALTAIGNDYGAEEAYARQVRAHGRPGDVLLALSTSGRSVNVLAAAEAGRECGLLVWALTGPSPNPLAERADEVLRVEASWSATVQEVHLVALHLLCAALDRRVEELRASQARTAQARTAQAGTAQAGTAQAGTAQADDGAAPDGAPRARDGLLRAVSGPSVREPAPSRPAPPSRPPGGRKTAIPAYGRSGGSRRPLVIVGDALLDRDLDGNVGRLSEDAPVPVVDEPVERLRPGGAGLAAVLAARDGRAVTLVTALADDVAGRELARALAEEGVEVVDLRRAGATPEKVRVRAGERSLLRMDRACRPSRPVGPATAEARAAISSAAAVLVADYGHGVAAEPGVREALAALPAGKPLVWDPHPRGADPVPGVLLATPNRAEASTLADRTTHGGLAVGGRDVAAPHREEGLTAVVARARSLAERWQAVFLCVTLGAEGALMVGGSGPPLAVPAPSGAGGDTCGAGDRFASRAAGLLADGALPSEAVPAAVASASAFVAAGGAGRVALGPRQGPDGFGHSVPDPGTRNGEGDRQAARVAEPGKRNGEGDRRAAPVAEPGVERTEPLTRRGAELTELLAGAGGTSVTESGAASVAGPGAEPVAGAGAERAEAVVAGVRAGKGIVVATGGCFDLLHPGHVSMLQAARALGDCLIVCLNSDASMRRLKGPDRPLVPEGDRAEVLEALACVDAVVIFGEDTPSAVLERLRPDLFAKGGDYAVADLPEAPLVESWGGQAVILPFVAGRSTTRLIEEAAYRGVGT